MAFAPKVGDRWKIQWPEDGGTYEVLVLSVKPEVNEGWVVVRGDWTNESSGSPFPNIECSIGPNHIIRPIEPLYCAECGKELEGIDYLCKRCRKNG